MNMFKKNGGFTLVELIVVIAILAILAGVAVPAYTGYIAKAKDAAVVNQLAAVHTAAMAANAVSKTEIKEITVSKDGVITVTWETPANAPTALTFYTDLATMLGNGSTATASGVTWDEIKTSFAASNAYKTSGAKWDATNSWQPAT